MTAKEGGSRGTEVCCQWFSGETLKSALFPIECLKSSIAPIEITPAQVRERLLNSPLVREALGQSGGGVEETAK